MKNIAVSAVYVNPKPMLIIVPISPPFKLKLVIKIHANSLETNAQIVRPIPRVCANLVPCSLTPKLPPFVRIENAMLSPNPITSKIIPAKNAKNENEFATVKVDGLFVGSKQ